MRQEGVSVVTEAQRTKLIDICKRYGVSFDEAHYRPTFDLPTGYVGGYIGGDRNLIYVGVDPAGRASS